MSSLIPGMLVTPNVRLVRSLGAGGMGSVWIAEHLTLHNQVVVKFIAEDMSRNEEAVARFAREAAAASQVRSPHVVQTFDHGVTADGVAYIVMELLEGEDLASYMDRTPQVPLEMVREVVVQMGRALEKAHDAGVVHRDIKPSNIFLCDAGDGAVFVKLLDFGIAKLGPNAKLSGDTKTGAMMGSPLYMSPEQLLGSKEIDARADLWALGVVVYEAMTGVRPYDADTIGGLTIKIFNEQPATPSGAARAGNRDLPLALDDWFTRACAVNLSNRFVNAREFVEGFRTAVADGHAGGHVQAPARTSPPTSSDALPLARSLSSTETGKTLLATSAGLKGRAVWIAVSTLAVFLLIGVAISLRPKSPEATNKATVTNVDSVQTASASARVLAEQLPTEIPALTASASIATSLATPAPTVSASALHATGGQHVPRATATSTAPVGVVAKPASSGDIY